jgi:hypothetical protein
MNNGHDVNTVPRDHIDCNVWQVFDDQFISAFNFAAPARARKHLKLGYGTKNGANDPIGYRFAILGYIVSNIRDIGYRRWLKTYALQN